MASAPSTVIQRATDSGLARLLGVSRQAIHQHVKKGTLPKAADGTIDVELARHAFENRVRPSSKTAEGLRRGAPPPAPVPAAPQTEAEANAHSDAAASSSFHVAKTLREAAEAQMARMKLAQMRGELLSLEDATKAAHEVGRQVRDALAVSRRRLSPYLAAAGTVSECEEILRKDHQALLDNLVAQLGKVVKTEALQA